MAIASTVTGNECSREPARKSWLCVLVFFVLFNVPSCRVVPRDVFLTEENAQNWIFLPSRGGFRAAAVQIAAAYEYQAEEIRYRLENLRPREWIIVGEECEVYGSFILALVRLRDGRIRLVKNYWERGHGLEITRWPECDVLCQWVEDVLHAFGRVVAPYAIERDPVLPGTQRAFDLASRLSHLPVSGAESSWGDDEPRILTIAWHTKRGSGHLVFNVRWVGRWRDSQGLPDDRRAFHVVHEIWTLLTQEARAEKPVWHIWGELPEEAPEYSRAPTRPE